MLIKRAVLDRIASGEIDLVFRKWRRPTVKAGGRLRTAVGMLDIVAVDTIARGAVTPADAHRAGYESRAALLRDLDSRTDGALYRIEVRLGGQDPRITLRNTSEFTDDDVAGLTTRLGRLDKAATAGPWTAEYLRLLDANPHVRAQDLAESLGLDKSTFKNNVRKLKTLGLTISHSPGYELSPRGRAYLAEIDG